MKTFKRVLYTLLALTAFAVIGVFLFVDDFEVTISEATAQGTFDAYIAENSLKTLGVETKVRSAAIDFKADDTMLIEAEFSSTAFGYTGHIEGTFKSGIDYRAPKIYLNEIDPVDITIRTDEETRNELSELRAAGRKFLNRQKRSGLSPNAEANLDRTIGESETDFQKSITAASYAFFEMVPIYSLNKAGYKGRLAGLALRDVQFTETEARVTLSPVLAIMRILGMIALALFVILYLIGPSLINLTAYKMFESRNGDAD